MFSFDGTCVYKLVETVDTETNILITVQNKPCGVSGIACYKEVTINVGSTRIKLVKGMGVDIGGTVFPDFTYRFNQLFIVTDNNASRSI